MYDRQLLESLGVSDPHAPQLSIPGREHAQVDGPLRVIAQDGTDIQTRHSLKRYQPEVPC